MISSPTGDVIRPQVRSGVNLGQVQATSADEAPPATVASKSGGGTGLVLPGGGARGAYQVGVLRGIAELMGEQVRSPFPIITGTSAGAINAVSLACSASNFRHGVARLSGVWRHFTVDKVFRCDWPGVGKNLGRWLWSLRRGDLGKHSPVSLLDNSPLRHLLERHLRLARIQHAIGTGSLRAVAVSAAGFRCGRTVAFYESDGAAKAWRRARREGRPCRLSLDHLMSAVGIPFIFPSVRIQNDYFGDGAVRESAPLSPAIHLGADRLLVIAVRDPSLAPTPELTRPSVGDMAGYLLNALFEDGLYNDIEQLTRINRMLGDPDRAVVNERREHQFRRVPAYVISPSRDISAIAARHAHRFPGASKLMLGALGGREALTSFLLFDGQYCREIMRLGYRDCLAQRGALERFLTGDSGETLHSAKSLPINS